jgi:hypothetical protein
VELADGCRLTSSGVKLNVAYLVTIVVVGTAITNDR